MKAYPKIKTICNSINSTTYLFYSFPSTWKWEQNLFLIIPKYTFLAIISFSFLCANINALQTQSTICQLCETGNFCTKNISTDPHLQL